MPEEGDRRHTDSGVSTREYLLRILDERDRTHQARINAQTEALQLAKTELERRLEGLNQLRNEVLSDRALLVRQDTYDAGLSSRDVRIRAVEDKVANHDNSIAQIQVINSDIEAIQKTLVQLEKTTASQEAVAAFKRLVYGFAFLAFISFGVALFNLITKSGG